MEFIDGFAWAVSTSFTSALDQCRFERGDRIYPSPDAYSSDWSEVRGRMKHWVQIRSPERRTGATILEGGSKFAANWVSEVHLTLHEEDRAPREIITTQGRVYTLLWRGDISVLDEKHLEPKVPERAVFVTKQIRGGEANLKALGNGETAFLMPFDGVSSLFIDKFERVNARLSPHLSRSPHFLRSCDVELLNALHVAPTTGLQCFFTRSLTPDELEKELKVELYRPAGNAGSDMFKISAHGVIV